MALQDCFLRRPSEIYDSHPVLLRIGRKCTDVPIFRDVLFPISTEFFRNFFGSRFDFILTHFHLFSFFFILLQNNVIHVVHLVYTTHNNKKKDIIIIINNINAEHKNKAINQHDQIKQKNTQEKSSIAQLQRTVRIKVLAVVLPLPIDS